uniref:Uncharacterized protein n=1 Tax=Oryza punctata TaxID=4537 RepID=A0A0E0M2G5_ORYPU
MAICTLGCQEMEVLMVMKDMMKVNQQVNDQELSSHAYRQKVDQVSDDEVSNHAYRQQVVVGAELTA